MTRMVRSVALLTLLATGLASSSCDRSGNAPRPPADASEPKGAALFVDATTDAGLDFVHATVDLEEYFFPSVMGGGCAFLDYDCDGLLDLYLINGADDARTSSSAAIALNRLYRQTGEGGFVDVTDDSGLGDVEHGMGVAIGDVNNDGFPDIYLTGHGADRLYLNQRNGAFRDISDAAGINNILWSASASFLDYDRDGWLDLFVTNYVNYFEDRSCPDAEGRRDFCGPQVFFNSTDRLYRNVSGEPLQASSADGRLEDVNVLFEDVSDAAGISALAGPGLGVACADFNGDRWCDIYVANDRVANFLWINQRNGSFEDEAVLRGVAYDVQGRAQAGMGIALGDVNGDATMDLHVTHFEGESNALYLSHVHGAFADRSAGAGLLAPTFPFTGFGTAFVDVNHDALADIVVVNGRVKRRAGPRPADLGGWMDYSETNQIFLGDPTGRFSMESAALDPFTITAEVSRGLATADFDRDGDIDLLVANIAGPARLFRNDAPKSGGWLKVWTVDPRWGGRDAYGAVVTVVAGDDHWTRPIQPGTSYLSSSEPVAHFGMADHEQIDEIRVDWPDGVSERFDGGAVNRGRRLERGTGQPIDARSQ